MQQPKRIVIIAGEESGDVHAASFVRELKQRNPNLEISGIGGQHMHDAGVTLISDLARFGVTGLSPSDKSTGWYYATRVGPGNDTDATMWQPNYSSFPMELLFSDPNVP